MVYTLSGGFIWVNLFITPMLLVSPVVISAFLKSSLSAELVQAVPVPEEKVPFLMLLAMVLLGFASNTIVVFYIAAFRKGGYDNNTPRTSQPDFLANNGFAARMKAAHANTYENLPIFAVAVYTAISLSLDKLILAKMCVFYILNRVAFIFCYGLNIDILRTFVYLVSFFTTVFMMAMSIFPEFNLDEEVSSLLAVLPMKIEL
jgi:uncharacterized MAPEG superfamily protein